MNAVSKMLIVVETAKLNRNSLTAVVTATADHHSIRSDLSVETETKLNWWRNVVLVPICEWVSYLFY